MLNLHHLYIFHTVARLESYSRAAERLGISQPAVSMQVKKLEEAVGVPLVETRGRQMALTEAGEALAEFAGRILRLEEEARQVMEDFRAVRRGRVRIAASSTPGTFVLPGVIAAFRKEAPGVAVSLEIGNTRSSLRLVAEGLADLAVVGDVSRDEADVALEPLCDDCLVVVVPPGHRWAEAGEAVSAAELAREPLILREEGSSTREVLDRRLRQAGFAPRVAMQMGSTEAVKEAVAAGLGPSVLSGWAVRREVAAGSLVAVAVAGLDLSRKLHLALPAGSSPGGVVARFVAYLKASDLGGGCELPAPGRATGGPTAN